jgi:uncharacterized protein (UPF0333 family)
MNNKGQISLEYILFSTIIVIMIILVASIAMDENEKNIILESARLGAQEGVDKNAYAMYYNDTFNHYQSDYPRLLYPTDIDIINITLKEEGTNKLTISINLFDFLKHCGIDFGNHNYAIPIGCNF